MRIHHLHVRDRHRLPLHVIAGDERSARRTIAISCGYA